MSISINGSTGISGVDGDATTPALQGGDTNTGISFGTDEVRINTGGTQRAVVDANGRVGVGTASPAQALHTAGSATTYVAAETTGTGTSAGFRLKGSASADYTIYTTQGVNQFAVYDNAAGAERMRISSTGQARVVAESSGLKSDTKAAPGTATYLFQGTHSATDAASGPLSIRIYTNGDVVNTNNSYGPIASDERLKQDIVDAGSQWDDIKAIRLTKFHYKNDPTGELQLGPIAQELEKVSPGLITRRPASEDEIADPSNSLVDGDEVLSFKASVLYMKAVGALQEAITRIETLEAEVQALKGGN